MTKNHNQQRVIVGQNMEAIKTEIIKQINEGIDAANEQLGYIAAGHVNQVEVTWIKQQTERKCLPSAN